MESNQNQETLRKVFDSFDKDKSGYIDISEVKLVSKELGHDITDSDAQKVFSVIDTNKDGKISFEEFILWWRSGKATKLEGLVYHLLKTQHLLSKANAELSRLGESVENKYDSSSEKHYVAIQAGEGESKTKLDIRVAFGGVEEKNLFDETLGGLQRPFDENSVIIRFKCSNPEVAKEGLRDLVEQAKEFLALAPAHVAEAFDLLHFDYIASDDSVAVVLTTQDGGIQTLAKNFSQTANAALGEQSGGLFHAHLGLKNDPASMFEGIEKNTTKNVIEELLEGFLISVKGNIPPTFMAFARSYYFGKMAATSNNNIIGTVLGLLLKGSKVVLKLKEINGETLKPILAKTPLGQIPLPSFGDLLDLAKMLGAEQLIDSIPLASQAMEFFRVHITADVQVTIRSEKFIGALNFQTKGIREVFNYIFDRD